MTHFINGQWVEGTGKSILSVDPANNNQLWNGKSATFEQVNDAVLAARQAQFDWFMQGFDYRLTIIEAFAKQLTHYQLPLAKCIAQETGKPLWECKTEVIGMIAKVNLSVDAYHKRTGHTETQLPIGNAVIRHKPHGVVAVFGPYNFPGHLPNGHIIPALLAGNTVVFKPSEFTPKVAEEIMKLWKKAGLPAGVINLIQGNAQTGIFLAQHKQIDGLFFTGSSKTGHLLHQQFADYPEKILALEMGGNNPLIVKDINNIDAAVHDIIQSAYISSGQRCTCARRLYIENGKAGDALVKKLIQTISTIQVGSWDQEPQPFMGSMISSHAALAMISAQNKLISLGGEVLVKLTILVENTGMVSPGLIDVSAIEQLPDEEYFGPLLQLIRYDNFDEAITLANNTRYGLSAGLLADNRADFDYFFARIRAGIVNWNRQITGASGSAPFGGIGASGNHRASAFYAADYCAYPVSSIEVDTLSLPENLSPGLNI